MDHISEGLCPMVASRHDTFEPAAELQDRGFQQLGTNNTELTGGVTYRRCHLQEVSLTGGVTYRGCHLQVIPQQYAEIFQSTDLTKNNLHNRISYLYDDLLIKQYMI